MKNAEERRFPGVAKPILDASERSFAGLVLTHETRVRKRARVAYAQWEEAVAYKPPAATNTPAPELRQKR